MSIRAPQSLIFITHKRFMWNTCFTFILASNDKLLAGNEESNTHTYLRKEHKIFAQSEMLFMYVWITVNLKIAVCPVQSQICIMLLLWYSCSTRVLKKRNKYKSFILFKHRSINWFFQQSICFFSVLMRFNCNVTWVFYAS